VYRHVPFPDEVLISPFAHRSWSIRDSGGRVTRLPSIRIPDSSITDGMARIAAAERFQMGIRGSPSTPSHDRSIPTFYMDPTEVPFSEYLKRAEGEAPYDNRTPVRSQDHAVILNWDWAVAMAEQLGKRLPDEAEYELAATNRGSSDFSWGDDAGMAREVAEHEFLVVGKPEFDRTDTAPPVIGLCSNVAEWTMTWADDRYPPLAERVGDVRDSPTLSYRVYRGGSAATIRGEKLADPAERNPRLRHTASRTSVEPGLGLRCVRSSQPRLRPEDFVRSLP
jgi:formylglycine-generating enzyme required for sulfatase activity